MDVLTLLLLLRFLLVSLASDWPEHKIRQLDVMSSEPRHRNAKVFMELSRHVAILDVFCSPIWHS
jgi:hypothetical protein